jgi:excisionase family DNA binding protein
MSFPSPDAQAIPAKALYRVPEAAKILSLSRSLVYRLIKSGRLGTVTEGRTRLVPASAIEDYIALLKQESEVA